MVQKKLPSKEYAKEKNIDIMLLGIRRAEGGQRRVSYTSCWDHSSKGYDKFFPVYWYTDEDMAHFDSLCSVEHSRAYSEYGMKRTGCAGCPFALNFEDELCIIDNHEPKLSKAVRKIFGPSYEWTRKYREYAARRRQEDRSSGPLMMQLELIEE